MKKRWKLATSLGAKLGLIGGGVLLLALVSIALTLSVSWQLEGGAAAVNEAGRMRMQAWRLAHELGNPDGGADAARVQSYVQEFERSLDVLRSGDPSRPLFVPHDARSTAAFAQVHEAWTLLRARWLQGPSPSASTRSRDAATFVAQIDAFVDAIESQLARWTTLLGVFQLAMLALAMATSVAMLYAAHLFVFEPLARLQHGLARVEAGDLTTRVAVASDDEFGALAAAFNRMAQTLRGLYQGLEAKVTEKTLHLRAQHERLTALYEAASLVGRTTTLEELAHGFAQQCRRVGHADAAAVRWRSESDQRYVLLASDCLPQQLVDEELCVFPGACHCGQAQAQARTQVIPIHSRDMRAAQGCARHGFESLVSVPVRLHERLVGEIDLFFRHPTTLGDDDRNLLEALASQLASAMDSLRVGALEREAGIANERTMLANELHDSIAQSLAFMKIQVQMLRRALQERDAATTQRVMQELDAGVRESTHDVRELLLNFRTRTNAEDITPALAITLQKLEHQSGLRTHLSVKGQGMPLPPDVQVQVLHVVQEALSNVRKHARAREVWVEVEQSPHWRVEVRDDGCGFAADAEPGQAHVGLRIMKERAARIGAAVQVHATLGMGTRVVLTLAATSVATSAATATATATAVATAVAA